MGNVNIKTIRLNSIEDNKKFNVNTIEILYSLPLNSFTLINDKKKNIYLAKIKKFENRLLNTNNDDLKKYKIKQHNNNKNSLLESYDSFLNNKYKVVLNQKTIERVKNFFQ